MNIDKKTAKARFTIEKHKDSYEIKEFANVTFRMGSPSKGSGYEYYFYSDQTPREIVIPDEIDRIVFGSVVDDKRCERVRILDPQRIQAGL